ncbi:hypothetical protein FNF29_08089 [Cafeteria roenbergensis]|uniref:BOP1 N-terminal domain-containing protein n=1 Tax=Cafeteria roenbergensis TaxID=33653 RepID=A0A5A8C147_CAFRO|nr:hypothetical protein FNF29_08089 [Cafeteria roenbergensis]|eukprot:KAA0146357.1 hypothetical protein FNF29_08089 [Cafeteria roenbergensis]
MPKRGRTSAPAAELAGSGSSAGRRSRSREVAEAKEVGFAWDGSKPVAGGKAGKRALSKQAARKGGVAVASGRAAAGRKGSAAASAQPGKQATRGKRAQAAEEETKSESVSEEEDEMQSASEDADEEEEEDEEGEDEGDWDGSWSSDEDEDAAGGAPASSHAGGGGGDDDDDSGDDAAAAESKSDSRYAAALEAAALRSRTRRAREAVTDAFNRAALGAQLATSSAEPSRATAEGRAAASRREEAARAAAALRARLPVSALARGVAASLGVLPAGLEAADADGAAARASARDPASAAAAAALAPSARPVAAMGAGTGDAAAVRMHVDDLSSDDEAPKNTAGSSVPREWYAGLPIVGYDVSGAPIARREGEDRIAQFLKSQEDPVAFRWTVYDSENDEEVTLSARDVGMLKTMREGGFAHPEFDETSDDYNLTDLFAVPDKDDPSALYSEGDYEPKRRFLPSRWEAMRVNKLRRAIREGRLRVRTAEERLADLDPKAKERAAREPTYSLWGADGMAVDPHDMASGALDPAHRPRGQPGHIAAPKPRPPGHAASYRPPREFLLTDKEREVWQATPRHRRPAGLEGDLEPTRYDSLRAVPAYAPLLRERFERCLDLYLAPRRVRQRLNVSDVASLLPKLPDPRELRPFPTTAAVTYEGHTGRVRCVDVSPDGQFVATGGDDGSLRVWDLETGRELRCWRFADVGDARNREAAAAGEAAEAAAAAAAAAADSDDEEAGAASIAAKAAASRAAAASAAAGLGGGSVIVSAVRWNPNPAAHVLLAAVGPDVIVVYPGLATPEQLQTTHSLLAGTAAEAARQAEATAQLAAARAAARADAIAAAGDDEDAAAEAAARADAADADAVATVALSRAARLAATMTDVVVPGSATSTAGDEDDVDADEAAAIARDSAPRPLEGAPSGGDAFDETVDGAAVPKARRRFVRWMWIAGQDGSTDHDEDVDVEDGADDAGAGSDAAYRRYSLSAAALSSPEALAAPGTAGVAACLRHHSAVRSLGWHPKGDYVVTVCPGAPVAPVLLHQLTKRRSQFPFTEAGGLALKGGAVQTAVFHPSAPELLIATRRAVRRYSLAKREQLQKLQRGPRWISCLAMHPEGEHMVVGGFDRRVSWFDTEVSEHAWQTLRYHEEAVRDAAFHQGAHPLLATASDDGRVQVFHARPPLPADMSMDPVIVPVKILRPCPRTEDGLATLALAWHPTQPWLVTAGADGKAVLHQDLP